MIKKAFVFVTIIILAIAFVFAGCTPAESNKQYYDNVYRFDEAIIQLPNGELVQGSVESWKDFDDGDQLQIRIDGVWYLVHSSNVVLISYYYEQP